MSANKETYAALLPSTDRASTESISSKYFADFERTTSPRQTRWQRFRPYALHIGLCLSYTTIFVAALFYVSVGRVEGGRSATILNPAMKHTVREVMYNFEATSAFKGPPISEVQDAWLALLNRPHSMRIPPSQMVTANMTSIRLSDGSGDYFVQPIAYHMLHCLYTLYRYNHLEFYGEEPAGPFWVTEHSDHCIENLRQFVMCHAGTGLSTFKWINAKKTPWGVLNAEETCVDWDFFDAYVKDHSVNMDELENAQTADGRPMLTHPKYGPISAEDVESASSKHLTAPYRLPEEIVAEVGN